MRLTVLGANGPFPAAGGACSGYLIESADEKTRLLIDLGAGALSNLLRVSRIEDLTAALITHLHFDHMSDFTVLKYLLDFSARGPLDLYLPDAPESVRALLKGGKFRLLPAEAAREIGSLCVETAPARHPVPARSVKIREGGKVLCLTGDTNLHPGLAPFLRGADAIVADAGFPARDWTMDKPHLSALGCAQLAREAGAGQLLLSHLNPLNDPAALLAEAQEVFPGARLAAALETIEL